jgi:hypothetical protein
MIRSGSAKPCTPPPKTNENKRSGRKYLPSIPLGVERCEPSEHYEPVLDLLLKRVGRSFTSRGRPQARWVEAPNNDSTDLSRLSHTAQPRPETRASSNGPTSPPRQNGTQRTNWAPKVMRKALGASTTVTFVLMLVVGASTGLVFRALDRRIDERTSGGFR